MKSLHSKDSKIPSTVLLTLLTFPLLVVHHLLTYSGKHTLHLGRCRHLPLTPQKNIICLSHTSPGEGDREAGAGNRWEDMGHSRLEHHNS